MSGLYIIPHHHEVSLASRVAQRGHKPMLVWLTGLSGSGKSTVANALEKKLFDEGYGTYILDGDNIRSGLNKDLDFSDASRVENIRRIGEVARLFVDAGLIVITAFISPFEAERDMVKSLIGEEHYCQVFVDCPIEVCEQRDVKGLYKKARNGEIKHFTGIDSPFETPKHPNITIDTSKQALEESVEVIYQYIKAKIQP